MIRLVNLLASSSPPTTNVRRGRGAVTQMVDVSGLSPESCGFESTRVRSHWSAENPLNSAGERGLIEVPKPRFSGATPGPATANSNVNGGSTAGPTRLNVDGDPSPTWLVFPRRCYLVRRS
jgi:hypothetical protein